MRRTGMRMRRFMAKTCPIDPDKRACQAASVVRRRSIRGRCASYAGSRRRVSGGHQRVGCRCILRSQPRRRLGLGPPHGRDPGGDSHTTTGGKALARSDIFLNGPTETISVMLLNDLNDLTGKETQRWKILPWNLNTATLSFVRQPLAYARGSVPHPFGQGADAQLLMAFCLACLALTGTATADSIAVRGVAFARFAPGPRTGRTSRPDAPGRNGRGMCARGPPFFATGASLPLVEAGRERKPPQPRPTRLRLRWRRPRNPQVFRGFVVRHVVAFLERTRPIEQR